MPNPVSFRILRVLYVYAQPYADGGRTRTFHALCVPKVSHNCGAVSFRETRLRVAASFSERGAPDQHYYHERELARSIPPRGSKVLG
jgi:hypothetical protein